MCPVGERKRDDKDARLEKEVWVGWLPTEVCISSVTVVEQQCVHKCALPQRARSLFALLLHTLLLSSHLTHLAPHHFSLFFPSPPLLLSSSHPSSLSTALSSCTVFSLGAQGL